MISNKAYEAKFEKLSQNREEVVLKTYKLSILGEVLSTDMVTRVHINSSLHKPRSQHGEIKDHTL